MNKKIKYLLVLSAVLATLVTVFIFLNSLQRPELSNKMSNSVVEILKPLLNPDGKLTHKTVSAFVRKAAHFLEFFVLGAVNCEIICIIRKKTKKLYIAHSMFALLLVSVLDEYLQSFVGRTSSVCDVVLDFSGAVIGFFVLFGINTLISREK